MKKFIALILLFAMALTLVACGDDKYEPVPSTEEEAKVIFTFKVEDKEYDVRYELYRMLFLNYKSEIDGGDSSVWSGENAEEYIARIEKIIIERAAEIYSTIHYAKELGFDAYSKDADKQAYEYVKLGVEGNGADIEGYGGDYDKYLASLKERNLNYSVADLLTRYALASIAIEEYYLGTEDAALGNLPGEFEVTEENVRNYYNSEDCARVLRMYFAEGIKTDEQLNEYRQALTEKTDAYEAALYIINVCPNVVASELIENPKDKKLGGMIVGRYALDSSTYGEFINTAFSIGEGDVSDVFEISDGGVKYHYIIYKVAKDAEHFSLCYEDIKSSYINNEMGKNLNTVKTSLVNSAGFTEEHGNIIHKDISMK